MPINLYNVMNAQYLGMKYGKKKPLTEHWFSTRLIENFRRSSSYLLSALHLKMTQQNVQQCSV